MGTHSIGPIDIAVSGLKAQGQNIRLITSNVANSQTTQTGSGDPYRRVEAVLKAAADPFGGVTVDEVAADMSQFPLVYKPGHPNADAQGYVQMPNVSLPMEMINLNVAARAYQANAAVLKRYQRMVETSLELLR